MLCRVCSSVYLLFFSPLLVFHIFLFFRFWLLTLCNLLTLLSPFLSFENGTLQSDKNGMLVFSFYYFLSLCSPDVLLFFLLVLILPFLPYSRSLPPRPLPPSIILGSILPCSNPILHNFPLLLLLLTPLLLPGNLSPFIIAYPVVSLLH